jgi:hypothetical protein
MKPGKTDIQDFLSSDKRKHERLALPIAVFYALKAKADERSMAWMTPVEVVDIGGHGMKIRSPHTLTTGTVLDLKIDFSDGSSPIVFTGEVAWSSQCPDTKIYCIGVKFYKMQHEDRKRFVSYMCENIIGACLDDEGQLKS